MFMRLLDDGLPIPYNLTSKIKPGRDLVMDTVATTKMSSKGQVVIPEQIREELGLQTGSQFVVIAKGDVVILKVLTAPPIQEFDDLIKQARTYAKKAGMTGKDINDAIKEVRKKK